MNSPEASPTPAATTPGPISGHRRDGGSGRSGSGMGAANWWTPPLLLVVDAPMVVMLLPSPHHGCAVYAVVFVTTARLATSNAIGRSRTLLVLDDAEGRFLVQEGQGPCRDVLGNCCGSLIKKQHACRPSGHCGRVPRAYPRVGSYTPTPWGPSIDRHAGRATISCQVNVPRSTTS